jgi:Flp pilus assembly protein TadD
LSADRLRALEAMREKNPRDTRVLFALAMEYEKGGDLSRVVDLLSDYLALTDDQGNAWGRLGHALRQLGRTEDARAAYARGVEAASRHGHPSMAAEFEDAVADLEGI